MQEMRTTVDLPDDLHAVARRMARDRGVTLSEAVADLMRRGLGHHRVTASVHSGDGALPVVRVGRPVTDADVASLDDDD